MGKKGRPPKEFHEYLTAPTKAHVGHKDYLISPGSAFLKYTVETKSAIDLCSRTFPKKADDTYVKDALDSLQHIVAAMLPAVMGHFETYERYLFAGMFDASVHLKKFDIEAFFKTISKVSNVAIDPIRLSAHRGLGTESLGILMAGCLSGWHDPDQVNRFFSGFRLKRQLFSSADSDRLKVLWQLRHSIVHTGGSLTLPDAQKVKELANLGNMKVVFENNFVYEVSRKLHPLVKRATEELGHAFKARLKATTPEEMRKKLNDFFSVKSSIHVRLKT